MKRVALLALAVGSLTACETPPSAPTALKPSFDVTVDQHVPFTFAAINPCTGELFSGSGFDHFKVFITTAPNFHMSVEENLENTKGVTATGVTYVVPAEVSSHTIFDSDVAPATVNAELSEKFIRQAEDGTLIMGDDFDLRERQQVTINANGVVTVDRSEFTIECR